MLKVFYTEVKPDGDQVSAEALHKAAHECLRQSVLSCLTGLYAQRVRAVKLSIAYGPHGKPYLTSHPSICFSLSHAGRMALCAISEMETGADIQDHRNMTDERVRRLAARFYAPEEQTLLSQAASPEDRKAHFFRIWAAKEAYAKYTGKGLSEDFTGFYADFDTMRIRRSGSDNVTLGFLSEPLTLPGYSVMICTDEPAPAAEVVTLTLDETFTAVFPDEPPAGTRTLSSPAMPGRTP